MIVNKGTKQAADSHREYLFTLPNVNRVGYGYLDLVPDEKSPFVLPDDIAASVVLVRVA